MSDQPASTVTLETQEPIKLKLRAAAEILADLAKPVAPKHLQTKPVKNNNTGVTTHVRFIPWHFVQQYFDLYAPLWTSEIRDVIHTGMPQPPKRCG